MEKVDDLRVIMRRWVSGVVVVTSAFEGQQHGMTVDSFTSVSLNPPMVTFTLANTTRTHALVSQSGLAGITLLHAGQAALSEWFAGRSGEHDRFEGVETFKSITGVPMIKEGMAFLEAKVIHQHAMPTSTLFIAEVITMAKIEDMEPLVYFNRAYHRLVDESKTINP